MGCDRTVGPQGAPGRAQLFNLRIAVLADLHVCASPRPPGRWHGPLEYDSAIERIDMVMAALQRTDVELVTVLGDLTDDGEPASVDLALRHLDRPHTAPVMLVEGNHDVLIRNGVVSTRLKGMGDRVVMATGEARSFDHVAVAGTGVRSAPAGPGLFLAEEPPMDELGEGELLVWLTHYPVLPLADALATHGLKDAGSPLNTAATLRAVTGRRGGPTLILHGHQHVRALVTSGAVAQYGQSALIEHPPAYAIVDISFDRETWGVSISARPLNGDSTAPWALCSTELRFRASSPDWVWTSFEPDR